MPSPLTASSAPQSHVHSQRLLVSLHAHLEGAQVVDGDCAVAAGRQQRMLPLVHCKVGNVVRVRAEGTAGVALPRVPDPDAAIIIACG